jgi:hypothetical protein
MIDQHKVFCIGFSKTGTTSMETALEILGFNVCRGDWRNRHTMYLQALWVNRDYKEILRMTTYWNAFADTPWGGTDLYVELLRAYPDAKYVLTEREPESWYRSFEKLITMFDLSLETALASYHVNGMWGSGYFFEHRFGIDKLAGNKDKIIAEYIAHNDRVKEYFGNRNKELLVVDLSKEDGWQRLCPFLGVAVPPIAFPHHNRAEQNPYLSNVAGPQGANA